MTNAAMASIVSAEFIPVSEETVRNCPTRLNFSFEYAIRTFYLTEKQRKTRLKFARRELEHTHGLEPVLEAVVRASGGGNGY
jgi:hypothetical protein